MDWRVFLVFFVSFLNECYSSCLHVHSNKTLCTTTTTAQTPKPEQESLWSSYQVAFFFGTFIVILIILCMVMIKRRGTMARNQQNANRESGNAGPLYGSDYFRSSLMIAAVSDIMYHGAQDRLRNSMSSESTEIVGEPVCPPKYEEIMKDSPPYDPPPSYRESLRYSVNEPQNNIASNESHFDLVSGNYV